MSKLNQDSLQQSTTRRVSLEEAGLPPLTFKQSSAGSSFISLSKTRVSEELGQAKFSSRTVGTIPDSKNSGKILFKEDFVAAFPILKEGYVERHAQGGYSFVFTDDHNEIPNHQYSYAEVVNQAKGRPRVHGKEQGKENGAHKAKNESSMQDSIEAKHTCTCCCHKDETTTTTFTPLPNDDVEIITALFKALADPTRFSIVYILLQRQQLSVGEISQLTKMSMSAVSHQLALLRMQKLVKVARDGVKNYYSLCDDHVSKLIELAIEHIHE